MKKDSELLSKKSLHELKSLETEVLIKIKGGDRRRTGRAGVAFRRSRGIG